MPIYNIGVTKPADLIAYLFEGQPHLLSGELMQWMEASSRYTAFVGTYRDKIRKKIRVIHEPESVLDLRAELEVAYCLLTERRLSVAYEPYASARRRGPDFAVTFRANLVFNVEVARLRVEESAADGIGLAGTQLAHKEERIVRILLDKLGQMQPAMPNLLVIHTREGLARSIELDRLMQAVKARVEAQRSILLHRQPLHQPARFLQGFSSSQRHPAVGAWRKAMDQQAGPPGPGGKNHAPGQFSAIRSMKNCWRGVRGLRQHAAASLAPHPIGTIFSPASRRKKWQKIVAPASR